MQTTRLDLPIRGMTCASCVARIEQGLRDIPGVSEVSVNLAGERATLTYDSAQVGIGEFVTAIRALGYEVPLKKLTLAIGGMSCASTASWSRSSPASSPSGAWRRESTSRRWRCSTR